MNIPVTQPWVAVNFSFKPICVGGQIALFHVQGEADGNWATIRETHDGFGRINYAIEAPRDLANYQTNDSSFAGALATAMQIVEDAK